MKVTNFADKKNGLDGAHEDIVMGIDEDNHLTLLNSLTHLYSNPVMAALREYCANASDAHKDSGQTKPFEVEFPYHHGGSYNLRVRDYGKGMSKAQITKVYSQYGATTKGKTNKQVGGFGLGSKSGLAVSNHLFVNTVSNGVLIKAQILKNKDQTSVIRILSETPTTAPSGTEIILPVSSKQLTQLKEHAAEELVGYKPEQVTLNRSPITYSVHDMEQFIPVTLGTNVIAYIARNTTAQQNIYGLPPHHPNLFKSDISVIMGGVYYPTLPSHGSVDSNQREFFMQVNALNERFRNSPKIILNVPVGSVNLPPHRDAIIDTEKTWNSLKNLISNLYMGLDSSLESYLNERSIGEASTIVASMSALFAPDDTWKHRGETYNNDFDKIMTNFPVLYSRVSQHYYRSGAIRLVGRLNTDGYRSVHCRVNDTNYNYANYHNMRKDKIVVLNFVVEKEKYDEVVAYEVNEKSHWQTRVQMKKPRLHSFMTRYLGSIADTVYGSDNYYVLITPTGTVIPDHLVSAIDFTVTEDILKAEYKKKFPPAPKKKVQHKHCRVTKDKIQHSLVSEDEKVVYFGGKDSYGTETFMAENVQLPQIHMMKKVSTGSIEQSAEHSWLFNGLFNLIDVDASLVALGSTRAEGSFKKAFKDSTPLGKIVMDYYENLDADRKLAVQHAYSLFALWQAPDPLFLMMGELKHSLMNKSVEFMFKERELIAVAHYLFAFKDNYVDGLLDWKQKFVKSLEGKELAWSMLLPLQSLVNDIYSNGQVRPVDGVYKTHLALRCANLLHEDYLISAVDKLTA